MCGPVAPCGEEGREEMTACRASSLCQDCWCRTTSAECWTWFCVSCMSNVMLSFNKRRPECADLECKKCIRDLVPLYSVCRPLRYAGDMLLPAS